MKGKSEQTSFAQNGNLVQRVEILDKEQITAQYILDVTEIGDTLRDITRKLPNWVKYKNDVRKILSKLIELDIIWTRETRKGVEMDEILLEAKWQAERFIYSFENSRRALNDFGNGYYHDLYLSL